MAYARVEQITATWRGRGARFTRIQLGREWRLDIPWNGYVTFREAAALLSVHEDTVRGWVERGQIEAGIYTGEDGSGTYVLALPLVRDAFRDVHGRYP